MSGDPNLDTTRPFIHQPIYSYLKQLIVSQRSVRHNDPIIKLIIRPPPLRRPMIVTQFDKGAFSLMEANFVVVKAGGGTSGDGHNGGARGGGGGHGGNVSIGDIVKGAVGVDEVHVIMGGSSGGGLIAQLIAQDPRLLDGVIHEGDLSALAIHIHNSIHFLRKSPGGHALTNPIHKEDQIPSRGPQHPHAILLLQLIQVSAVVLINAAAVLQNAIPGHDPGAMPELGGGGRKGGFQDVRVARGDPDLDGAGPGVDLAVEPNLKDLIVLQGERGEDETVIEFLGGVGAVGGAAARGEGHQVTAAAVECQERGGRRGGGCGRIRWPGR